MVATGQMDISNTRPLSFPEGFKLVLWAQEEFEDIKVVIRIRKQKKDIRHNDQRKKDKRANNDLQNSSYKTTVYNMRETIGKSISCQLL